MCWVKHFDATWIKMIDGKEKLFDRKTREITNILRRYKESIFSGHLWDLFWQIILHRSTCFTLINTICSILIGILLEYYLNMCYSIHLYLSCVILYRCYQTIDWKWKMLSDRLVYIIPVMQGMFYLKLLHLQIQEKTQHQQSLSMFLLFNCFIIYLR